MSKILIKLLIYGFIALANAAFANNDDSSETTTNQQPNDNKTMTEQANTTLPVVLMKTSLGDIEIQLNSDKAPATVTNFLNYVQSGHYDGTIFHRVIPGFMIQGGGFEQGMTQKSVNAPVLNEANNGLTNDTFTIAMARTSDPHSATAQFFINVNDNSSLNFSSETSRGWGYAVFGKVTKGDDIVKAIEAVSTGNAAGHADVPQEDVIITSVTVVK